MKTLRVAAVAFRSEFGQVKRNLGCILQWMERAAERGVRLVCFPEIALQGYCSVPDIVRGLSESITGPSCTAIHRHAKALGITASVGMSLREKEKVYNSQVFIGPSGFLGAQHKVHLCGIDHAYDAGNSWSVVEVDGWRIGTTICFDSEFPEAPRVLALKRADLLVMSFASGRRDALGEPAEPKDWPNEVLRWAPARAYDNRVFVVAVNHAGDVSDPHGYAVANPSGVQGTEEWAPAGTVHRWPGYCFVISPLGLLIADSDRSSNRENVIVIDLDPFALKRARRKLKAKWDRGEKEGDMLSIRRTDTFAGLLSPPESDKSTS